MSSAEGNAEDSGTRRPWWLSRVCSRIYPDDPQAVVTLVSSAALLIYAAAIVRGVVHQLMDGCDIAWGTVGALAVALAAPCALAHIKPPGMPFQPPTSDSKDGGHDA